MVSSSLSSLNGGLLSGGLANKIGGLTFFELGKQAGGVSNYHVVGSTVTMTTQYPLGILFGDACITRPLQIATSSYKTAALRFRIHLFGTWSGQPCTVSTNGDTIFQRTFTGTNLFKDIEIQLPYSQNLANLVFSCNTGGQNALGWTITDAGFHFDKCPLEYLSSSVDGDCQYVGNSLFSGIASNSAATLINNAYDTPAWASSLTTGTTSSSNQIVIIRHQPAVIAAPGPSLSSLISTSLFFIGSNFGYSSFSYGDANVGITYFDGYPVFGLFSGATLLSRSFTTLASTQSAALRLRLYLLGTWNNVPFAFQAGGVPIFSTVLSGSNTFQDIEIQFAAGTQPVAISFGISASVGSPFLVPGAYQWAVSDLAFVASNAPIGKIYSQSTNGFVAVTDSFFTPLLNNLYNKVLPGYEIQPIWLNKVIAGQFTSAFDTIVVRGTPLALGGVGQSLNFVNILGGSNAYAPGITASSITNLISTNLFLIGPNAPISAFTGIGSAGMTFLNGFPVLGLFSAPAVISTGLTSLASTQSGILRLRLHTVGVWVNVPFGFTVGGTNVFSTLITGTDSFQDIEIQFALGSGLQVPLAFGITLATTPVVLAELTGLQWAVSNVAIVYSNAPCGQIYSPLTSGFNTITGSFITSLLTTIYNQQFPGVAIQPIWLNNVALGLFNPQTDIIAVNGVCIDLAAPVIPLSSLSTLVPASLFLVGTNFNFNAFTTNIGTPGLTFVNGYPCLGTFTGANIISTTLTTIDTTQSIALRLRLHVLGVWNNVGFNFLNGGNLILSTLINGANQFVDIELQFAAGANQAIQLTFGLQDQASLLQYAISDVAIVFSNAPCGQILNIVTGGFSPVLGSFFTPLLNNIYTTGFPGYAIQPIWLQKVQLGVFSSDFDIIGINGNILPLSTVAVTTQAISTGLTGLLSTQLMLSGPNFDFSGFNCGCDHGVTSFGGLPVLGMYSYDNVLTTTLAVPLGAQSCAARFSLFMSGDWVNVPFGITANDVNVFTAFLTGSNEFHHIELQFPCGGLSQQVLLAFSVSQSALLAPQFGSIQWGIGQFAVAFSNAPVGSIFNLVTGGFIPVGTSFFTTLLNSYYLSGFPGALAQPSWLQYVTNGIFSPLLDIIAVNGVNCNFGTPAAIASYGLVPVNLQVLQAAQIPALTTFFAQNSVALQLLGPNFDFGAFNCVGTTLIPSYFNGIPVLGGLSSTSVLTTSFTTLANTQAVAYRFTLYFVDTPVTAPFTILANGVPVFSATLSSGNNFYQIECQFAAAPLTQIQLSLSFGSVSTPFQWAIGEVGYALISTPCGTIFNLVSGGTVPISTSYFTALLNSLYLAQFPGYAVQPSWLQLVLTGNFASPFNLIAINGELLNFGVGNLIGAPIGPGLGVSSSQFFTTLQLVGPNFNLANFACDSGVSMVYLSGIPALGLFQPSSFLTTTIFPLATTQAAIYRFSLHVVGALSSQPFCITANGVNIFSATLVGGNQIFQIETQFVTLNQQAIVLGFGFGCGQTLGSNLQFQWGISNVAFSFSTTPVGTILVPSTGLSIPIQGSYFTTLLSTHFGGSFPDVIQQPIWLHSVLNGLFNNVNDFIAVGGNLISLPLVSECNQLISSFLDNSLLSFQLLGPNMVLSGWSFSSGAPIGIYPINGVSFAGPFAVGPILGTSINALLSTQSVALRFSLYTIGSAIGAPFFVTANGVNVLSMELTAANQFRLIEVQFTVAAGQPIALGFGFSSIGNSIGPFQWCLGEVAIALSSSPAGTILGIASNTAVALQNSYFTPLLNSYLAPTLATLSIVPTWLNYVRAGQFSDLIDTICVNGAIIPLGLGTYGPALAGLAGPSIGSTIAIYQSLQALQTPASIASFFAQSGTILSLVGNNFDFSNFLSSDTVLGIQTIFGSPCLGYLLPTSALTTTFTTLGSTQAVALRFNLFVVGNVLNAPFTITCGGVPVFSTLLTGTNMIQLIEAQFAVLPNQALNFVFSFGPLSGAQFEWGINELAISFSSTPVGTIFNSLLGVPLPIQGSYFTPLLHIYSNHQIMGYIQQPSWLQPVLSGFFSGLNNIIAVNNVCIPLESIALPSLAFANFAPSFLQTTQTVLQLIGPNMNLAGWSLSSGTVGVTFINGIPALGQIAPGAILSTNIALLETTQAVALRFNLYVTGPCTNVPFVVSAGGVPVLSFPLTANNEFRLIEVQFAVPVVSTIALSFGFDLGSGPASFQWAIGDLAYSLSNTACGTIFNTATGNVMSIQTSYFTSLLPSYQGMFSGYSTQPIWLSHVLGGQFNSAFDILGVCGQLVDLAPFALNPSLATLSSQVATVVLTSSFPSLSYLQAATLGTGSIVPTFFSSSLTTLQLVGPGFGFPGFSCNNAALQVISVEGFPVLGGMNAYSVLTTTIPILGATQAIATRFSLYLIGSVASVPFTVTANGVTVLSTVLTGCNTYRNIELQFVAPVGLTSIPLVFSFGTGSIDTALLGFNWGISEFAVSLSPTPVGTILNCVTGGYNAVPLSYFTPLLATYFQGQFPGVLHQPSWLSYVLNGQFSNVIDIIAINGNCLTLPGTNIGLLALQPSGNLANFYAATSTSLLLVGPNFNLGLWSASSLAPLAITTLGGLPCLGTFGPSEVLFTVLTPLPLTQAIVLRFNLFLNGNWQNVGFGIGANGVDIFQTVLTGENQFRMIEVQFPCTTGVSQIVLSFGINGLPVGAPVTWAISQVAIAYSNAPCGSIFSPVIGAPVALLNSYFTPLLSSYLPGLFTGYGTQPIWLNYVRSGFFSTPIDIIAGCGTILNLDIACIPTASALASFMTFSPTAAITFTNELSSIALLQSSIVTPNPLISSFLSSTQTILQLVGSNLDYSLFSGNCDFGLVYPLHSIPAIGYFPETGILTQTLLPIAGTQSVALRFTLYTVGQITTAPLTIVANGITVFSAVLSPSSSLFNIEVQFPYVFNECQPGVVLSISFTPVPTVVATEAVFASPFQWALSQVAISYSNAPCGYIFNPVTNGFSPILNSYFTPLLQIYGGSFPGYTSQPIWLNQVLFGQFVSGTDFIAVSNTLLNLGGVPFSLAQANAFAADFLTSTSTVLELIGTNFNVNAFTVSGGPIGLSYINEIPVLGSFAPGVILSTNLYPLASTQAVALRFQLFVTGPCTNVPFTILANGVNVLTAILTATNEFRLVEVQFPYTYVAASPTIALSIAFNTASLPVAATSFQWAISQLAIAYSNAPVGFIFSSATGGFVPVATSFFTPLLSVYYGGSFPGYASQPLWLNYVLNGQFSPAIDIIAINSVLLDFPVVSGIPTCPLAIALTPGFSSLPLLQNTNFASTFLAQTSTVLQLIGTNFPYTQFTVSTGGSLGLTTVNGLQILGTLMPTDILTTILTPLATTQAIAFRFTLFFVGAPAYAPISILANGVPVLSTMLTGAAYQNIEVQFPCTTGIQPIPLAIGFGPTTQSFTWGIGQVAISYSNAPCGTILSSATGAYIPVVASYFTPLLGTYLGGVFPDCAIQPSWLAVVQNAQFTNEFDIIAINGRLVDFGSFGPATLQTSLLNTNFLAQTTSILELCGPNFPTVGFSVTNGVIGTTTIGTLSLPVLGLFSPSCVLSYAFTPIAITQSVAIRFMLFVDGVANNVPFVVTGNGVNVFTGILSGNNFFHNIEIQIPFVAGQSIAPFPLTFAFVGGEPTGFQWGIGQLAIVCSNAPVGFIYSTLTGGNVPLISSFFTPLLGVHYGGAFPGYPLDQQPLWIPYVLAGQFTNGIDFIAINGVNLNLAEIPTPFAMTLPTLFQSCVGAPLLNDFTTLGLILSNSQLPLFSSQTLTVLELVGSAPSFANFVSSSPFGLVFIDNVPSIGYFSPTCTVAYPLMPLTSTLAGIVRFTLFVTGSLTNVPFTVTVGGANVLTVALTGSNFYQNIEVQFPLSYAVGIPQVDFVLGFGSAAQGLPFQWAISQFAVSYSNTPCGTIFNSITGGYVPVVSSYLTSCLQNYLGGSFPGYSIQPNWLSQVLAGEFTNEFDIIAIQGTVLNLGTPIYRAEMFQTLLAKSAFLAQTLTVLELCGPNFGFSNFAVTGGVPLGTCTIGSIPALGLFGPTSVLTYSLAPTAFTQAGIVRFTLLVDGPCANVPFTVSACGVNVLSTVLAGTDFFRNIEIQFPLGNAACDLTIGFGSPDGIALSSLPFQWAISQFAVSYSNAPVGFILSNLNNGFNALTSSFFTTALQTFYGGSFPGYTTQPLWLPYVLNGQFNNALDIIAISGVPLNFFTPMAIPYSSLAIPLNTGFPCLDSLQTNQFVSTFISQTSTVLELVGANFPLNAFTSNTPLGIVYADGVPMLGYLTPFSTLGYTLTPTAFTQSCIARFQLFGVGPITNLPFTISANGVNILTTVLSGIDLFRNIEVQFPCSVAPGLSSIPLAMSFVTDSLPTSAATFQWGISQFAVTYSNAPVGFYLNSVTGGYAPIISSFYTPVVPIYHGCSFPGYVAAQQPIWLPYVLNGQFSNAIDIISINGNILNFDSAILGGQLQVLQAANFGPTFAAQTQTILELVGSNFPISSFAISVGTLGTSIINSIPVLGPFPATGVLTYPLSPLTFTKAGALRFLLFVSGPCENVPFVVSLNGVNVLYTGLSGSNFFHNIEVQFPLSLSTGSNVLAFSFDTSILGGAAPAFQWSVSQFAIHYSNAPIGFIFNSYNGGFSPVCSSYYTPLMGVFYGSSIPGYAASQQPIWLPYVQAGQFQNGIDIVCINNAILNFGTPTIVLSNGFPGLSIFTGSNFASTFASETLTSLFMVGDNFDFSGFTSTTSFRLLHINSVPVIGYFLPSSVVSTTLVPLSTTQSIAVRFSLFLLGDTISAPLIITANGVPVLNALISTDGYLQNIECVFPFTYAVGQPNVVLAITFGSTSIPFNWAMSHFAVSYSNAPCGSIFNSLTGGFVPLVNSYFTALLQNYYGGAFPGYSVAQQPMWLTYVQNGQFSNGLDIICVNGNLLNFALASPFAIRNSLVQQSFFTQTQTVLELVGSNFGYPGFSLSTGALGITTIGSLPCLGQFGPGAVLSYALAPLASTQAINLRFMLFVSGTCNNVPFTLTANNVEILTVPLTGTDFFRNIEVQFPYTFGALNNVLAFSFGPAGVSQSFQWAISQMAISYSNAPVGFIFNAQSLGYSPIQYSYFTPALSNFYGSSFPGYTVAEQPIWLPYVLNGQFSNDIDIISLGGNILNFAPCAVPLQSAFAVPLTSGFSSLPLFQSTSLISQLLPQFSTILELVGLNFNTGLFSFNTGSFGLNYVDGVPVLGNFFPSTIVSYPLSPLATTQSISVRFNLYTIGTVSAAPFAVSCNGVNYLSTAITSTNSFHFIEVNFPYTPDLSACTLGINFALPTQSLSNFQWAISQFAVTYSSAPCGYIPNTVTGTYNAITTSFHSMVLPTFYGGAYPGYAVQPTWLNHVLGGQFVNSIDIIAINGNILNFGRLAPSFVGLFELTGIPQCSSSILNFVPYMQHVGRQFQFGGVTQNAVGLFNFSPLEIDLVGWPLSNLGQWTVSSGALNTITLDGIPALGYFSPGIVLTRQYLNLGSYSSLGTIFQLFVASPTGFTFRVQANGVTILQQVLQAGTYSNIMEAHFEIAEPNVVLTFTAILDSGVALANSGGWAIGSVGFISNPCDIRNFWNLNVGACQYAGNSVFHAQAFVNHRQGFSFLTTQPAWFQAFSTNNIGVSNQFFFINNANVPYLTGLESALVSPVSIHRLQYALLGGNHMIFDLVGNNFNLPIWSLSTGSVFTSTLGGIQVLGPFGLGSVLSATFATASVHASVILRFRLHGVGPWDNFRFYTALGGVNILTRDFTFTDDFRDIEIQFVHTAPTLDLSFGFIASNGVTFGPGVSFAISNVVLHLNPCAIQNTFNVLLNTCMSAGSTAIYSLFRSDYWGQFYGNPGLNLAYLNKFQSIFNLIDDGREIYGSWTGPTTAFPGQVLLELSGPNFGFDNWQVRGVRQAAYTSELYGSTVFGPYEPTAVLRRVFTGLPAHSTIVGRLRLYLVGSWIDQNTIIQVGGVTVFQYVLGFSNTYQDIEFAFDHTGSTLDFTILSSAASSIGVREGIQFGISNFALYVSPCAQRSFFDIGLGSCVATTGYSTFYHLVQTNLAGFFPVVAVRPIWIIVLTPVTGIDLLAHEVYSFLRGNQLQVIIGVNGKPQFVDLDLLTRLKDQIDSTPVVSQGDAYDLSFLSSRSSKNIIGDYKEGTLTSYGQNYDNLFGTSLTQSGVKQFMFAFGIVTGDACVGMIEAKDVTTLDLSANLRGQSLVVCSKDLTQPETKFLVKIDTDRKTISFQDQFYSEQSKTLNFNDAKNLYYTVQFQGKGTVYFGKSADSYQPGGQAANKANN